MGAGPAGVAAGLEARRLGLEALVVDKANFPRDKTCGDGLTTGALRRLEALGLDVRALPSYAPVTETVLVSPTGREVVVPLPVDGAYAGVVTRVELDAALVDLARARGVDVRESTAVVAVDEDNTTTLADGTIVRPRWIVAADGHYSPVRHMLTGSARAELGTWHAFRQYFTGVDDRRLWVLFEEDFLPGYAWVFPVGHGRANVGFGVLRTSTALRRARPSPRSGVRSPIARACGAPSAQRAARMVQCGPGPSPPRTTGRASLTVAALFVGDAASVVDPMTGEGIAQALETGTLAARAVAASPDDPDVVAARIAPTSTVHSAPTSALLRCCNTSSACRSAPELRSPPPRSHRGPAATSPAGCSRTTHVPSCSRRAAGVRARSLRVAPTRAPWCRRLCRSTAGRAGPRTRGASP